MWDYPKQGSPLGGMCFAALWPEADHIPFPSRKNGSELGREKVEELAEIADLTALIRSHSPRLTGSWHKDLEGQKLQVFVEASKNVCFKHSNPVLF